MNKKRNLDGSRHKRSSKKIGKTKANKQIREKFWKSMNKRKVKAKRSGNPAAAATAAANTKVDTIKTTNKIFVGIDLHKTFMQVAVVDDEGTDLMNRRVENTRKDIQYLFEAMPKNAQYVIESSSVWYGVYRFLTGDLGLDVILSNPYQTRLIAESKKKTDKIDAKILADMLRGGYISECYVPDQDIVDVRQLIRYRAKIVQQRTKFKNFIHAILLQDSIKISASPFTAQFIKELYELGDWRIDEHLKVISSLNDRIMTADIRIAEMFKYDSDAQLLETIPGIGKFTALLLTSEIGQIDRFINSDKLVAYFGLTPSVRGSADIVHHGRITRMGSSMVRWALTEAVHTHVRYAPDSDITEFYKRIAKKRGRSKAAVAAAAKMLRLVYWMLKKKTDFAKMIEDKNDELEQRTAEKRKKMRKSKVKNKSTRIRKKL